MKTYHVTEVVGAFSDYSAVRPEVLENAAQRGRRVHSGCAAYARKLPVLCLKPEDAGYFESFKQWFDAYVARVFFVEKRFACGVFGITGMVDLGCGLIDGRRVIVDHKTPAGESRTWRGQVAAYKYLAEKAEGVRFDGIMALQLDGKGGPAKGRVYDEEIAEAWAGFLSALAAIRYFKG